MKVTDGGTCDVARARTITLELATLLTDIVPCEAHRVIMVDNGAITVDE